MSLSPFANLKRERRGRRGDGLGGELPSTPHLSLMINLETLPLIDLLKGVVVSPERRSILPLSLLCILRRCSGGVFESLRQSILPEMNGGRHELVTEISDLPSSGSWDFCNHLVGVKPIQRTGDPGALLFHLVFVFGIHAACDRRAQEALSQQLHPLEFLRKTGSPRG